MAMTAIYANDDDVVAANDNWMEPTWSYSCFVLLFIFSVLNTFLFVGALIRHRSQLPSWEFTYSSSCIHTDTYTLNLTSSKGKWNMLTWKMCSFSLSFLCSVTDILVRTSASSVLHTDTYHALSISRLVRIYIRCFHPIFSAWRVRDWRLSPRRRCSDCTASCRCKCGKKQLM